MLTTSQSNRSDKSSARKLSESDIKISTPAEHNDFDRRSRHFSSQYVSSENSQNRD